MIEINFGNYFSFDDLVEELFWKDQYMHQELTTYIKDTNKNKWYEIERKYYYADPIYLFNNNYKVVFHEINDVELEEELNQFFYE